MSKQIYLIIHVCSINTPWALDLISTLLLHNLLFQACRVVGLMVKHMSTTVFNGIAKGHGVGCVSGITFNT
jgi:hypothetical protein